MGASQGPKKDLADTPCQLPGRGAKYGPGQGRGYIGIRGHPPRQGAPKGGAPLAKKRGGDLDS